jgi:hypothetical protein
MIGFAESEDIGALPPIAQFARYVLFVKTIGSHSESSVMPAKAGIQALTTVWNPAGAGMTKTTGRDSI